ncbi:MAG: ABC transporter permease subunit [Pirellulales bacterium]
MFIGPVFTRESSVTPRRTTLYVYRSVYVAAFFLLICTAWLVMAGTQIINTVGDMARFGALLFQILAPIQLGLVIFFAAFSSASAVAQEKDKKTLILLMMTRLNNSELVLGKMLASLLNIIVLIFAALPLFAASILFGGVSPTQVLLVLAVTLCTAFAAGSLGALIALWREKTFQTLSLTALVIVIWLGFAEALNAGLLGSNFMGFSAELLGIATSPIRAVMEAAQPYPMSVSGLGSWLTPVGLYFGVISAIALILNVVSISLVRVWNPSREARRSNGANAEAQESIWGEGQDAESPAPDSEALAQQADKIRDEHVDGRTHQVNQKHREVWDNPILWRETQTWAYGRKVLAIRFVYLLLAAFAILILYGFVQSGSLIVYGDQIGTVIPVAAKPLVPLFLVSLVIVNALAVTSITNERDGLALDLLLVTDLSPKELIFGKLFGIMWVTKEMIVVPFLASIYLWYVGGISLENMIYVLGGLAVMYFFVTMLGIHCGMIYASSRTAIGVSLGTVFFLFLGVATCLLLMISFSESFHFQLFPFLGFIAGGGLGLYVAIGYRNPSPAISLAAFVVPLSTFYAITTFLLNKSFEVFLVTALAYGFTTFAMMIPALYEFDVEMVRKSGQDED